MMRGVASLTLFLYELIVVKALQGINCASFDGQLRLVADPMQVRYLTSCVVVASSD